MGLSEQPTNDIRTFQQAFIDCGVLVNSKIGIRSSVGRDSYIGERVRIFDDVTIGDKVSIYGDTTINYGTRVEDRVRIETHGEIGQNNLVQDSVSIGPNV